MSDLTPRRQAPGSQASDGQAPGTAAATAAEEMNAEGLASARALVRRRQLRIGFVIVVLVVVGGFVAIQGLRNATLFFRNADEAIAQRDDLDERRFRLQGRVVPATVENDSGVTTFEVIHNCAVVSVRHTTDPPELFSSPWIPVVLEGAWTAGATTNSAGSDTHYFLSDRILVKHTNEYASANETRVSTEAPTGFLDDCSAQLRDAVS